MKKSSFIAVIFCLFIVLLINVNSHGSDNDRITPTVKAVNKVLPSVVNLSTEKIITRQNSPFGVLDPFSGMWEDFFAQQSRQKSYSLGSGCIIESSGLIVTNAHVVHKATRIEVTLSDGRKFTAKEIASDQVNDLALLQLTDIPKGVSFKPIELAGPGDLLLGETVIAVGNPYGLGNSISKGVLSAVGRKAVYKGQVIFKDILQTDAAINPGNSGGPLININAELIGINTAIYQEAQNIGFAIPHQRIENILAKWLIPESFKNVSLGIIPGVKKTGLGKQAIYLEDVIKGSPAWKSGLKKGEEISELNGVPVKTILQFGRVIWGLSAGKSIKIKLKSGKEVSLKVENLRLIDGKSVAQRRLGITLQPLTPKLATALGYPFEEGVIISDIEPGYDNIKRGDVLVRMGEVPIYELSDISKAMRAMHYGDKVKAMFISIVKRGRRRYLVKKYAELEVK